MGCTETEIPHSLPSTFSAPSTTTQDMAVSPSMDLAVSHEQSEVIPMVLLVAPEEASKEERPPGSKQGMRLPGGGRVGDPPIIGWITGRRCQ